MTYKVGDEVRLRENLYHRRARDAAFAPGERGTVVLVERFEDGYVALEIALLNGRADNNGENSWPVELSEIERAE